MLLSTNNKKAELIDKVLAHIQARLDPAQAPQPKRFARYYLTGVSPEDLLERSVQDLYGATLAHWTFARTRRTGERLVRVYNPTLEEHGWQSTHTIVEIVQLDMPFLVDSVRMEVNRTGLTVHLIIHPVMPVRRDADGRLEEILERDSGEDGAEDEAIMHFEVDRITDPRRLDALRENIVRVLDDVADAVGDWQPMRHTLADIVRAMDTNPPPIADDEWREARTFLEWLNDDHFTFLGYRKYRLTSTEDGDALLIVPGSGLGILRAEGQERFSRSFAQLPPEARRLAREPELLIVTKSNTRATVHRPVYMDYVGVKIFDPGGNVIGEHRFLGLYTSSAYHQRIFQIPIVRKKIRYVIEYCELRPASHSYKTLVDTLEGLPRDELFQSTAQELFDTALGILHLQERQRVRLLVRRDPYARFLSCLIYLPRERFNTQVRLRIQNMLQHAFNARSTEFTVSLSESALARLYLIAHTETGEFPEFDAHDLEQRIIEASRTWEDDLHESLIHELGEELGNQHFARYRAAFPASYCEDYIPAVAVHDIQKMEQLGTSDRLGMALYHPLEAPEDLLRLKLFHHGDPITLSTLLPMLEHMGVQVIDERPHEITPADDLPIWIHDIGMAYRHVGRLDTEEIRDIFQQAFARIWSGEVEDDGFNRLVLTSQLSWPDVVMLRAYYKYLRQTEFPFSQGYVEHALAENPQITRLLSDLFGLRFDPARAGQSEKRIVQICEAMDQSLDAVPSLDEDRILRRFYALVRCTLRTNFFCRDPRRQAAHYLSFKLDPGDLPGIPAPKPNYEIFVYSPRTEGVHLRGGKVARGGIRWSDRPEDFRTEVFGLMKAQMVKNAVIVPVGAKGGFVIKRTAFDGDREALRREVLECYCLFIRGLLDITDNLIGGSAQTPERVVRYDDDDPYLVVAADKGTATFSDTANAIAKEYGFWLGDAFASGGSTGYDHKEMGITARGAWESTKRHFRELGIDIQREDFTAVGIGDMSGDVFGNGMLLSEHIRLVAAFDHRHIFIDPDPDPAKSYAERRRLFALPRSSWADYDPACMSEGGGVYPRGAKSITLSPQAQAALGTDARQLTPNELVQVVLTGPADLLWNGGIGTFVKAAHETHADADDRTNDAIRVDAERLRCKVIGEGGNLGLTYEARIAYASNGGRINTDFIDNSGGVDCSDHEVNIKILLDEEVREGELSEKHRNKLLKEMTEEVADLVLRNNYLQTEALSISEQHAPSLLDEHAGLIRVLEKKGRLERTTWHLPDDEEIEARRRANTGLTRPELAVLLAYAKIDLYDALLTSEVGDDSYLGEQITGYFPKPIRQRYAERMQAHRLRREIVATYIANSMVNRMGTTFAFRVKEHTGAAEADIARAYMISRRVFRLSELSHAVETLDPDVDPQQQMGTLVEIRKLASRATLWFLRNRRQPLEVATEIDAFAVSMERLCDALPDVLEPDDRAAALERAEHYRMRGFPDAVASQIASLRALASGLDIAEVATELGTPVESVARLYFLLGAELRLHWLRDRIAALPVDEHWPRLARAGLRAELFRLQRILTRDALMATPGDIDPEEVLRAWERHNESAVTRYLERFAELQSGPAIEFAGVTVALDEVRKLLRAITPRSTSDTNPPS